MGLQRLDLATDHHRLFGELLQHLHGGYLVLRGHSHLLPVLGEEYPLIVDDARQGLDHLLDDPVVRVERGPDVARIKEPLQGLLGHNRQVGRLALLAHAHIIAVIGRHVKDPPLSFVRPVPPSTASGLAPCPSPQPSPLL